MLITKKIIDLIIYAHENGVDIQEFEAMDSTDTDVVDDAEPKKKERKKKYNYTVKEKPTGASISDKDVMTMRQFLCVQKSLGKLSAEQTAALDETKGKFARTLTLGQREQIKDMFEEIKGIN
jgi:hypothetical protein